MMGGLGTFPPFVVPDRLPMFPKLSVEVIPVTLPDFEGPLPGVAGRVPEFFLSLLFSDDPLF